jgi:hypothetical protein
MQTGSSSSLIGWKSGQTTYFPLWDRMEGSWLWTLVDNNQRRHYSSVMPSFLYAAMGTTNTKTGADSYNGKEQQLL